MLFSTLVKESYKSISEAENEELQTAIENVIVAKKLDKYKRASSITDDKFREAVQLVKDAVKNKFTDTEIKNALSKELYNMLPESERPSKKKVLRESEKKKLKESSLNDVMENWYDEEVDILPSQYADSYHKVLHNMQEVKEYNYHRDYWGDAEEYQENAERLMKDIEPFIGQTVDYDTDEGTIKVKVQGVDIDSQYNGHLAVRVDIVEEPVKEANTELNNKPNNSITAEEFLDSTITVYDIADYVEHLVIGTSSVPYTTHTGPKRAILQDINGKYIVADYEAVRDIADTENDDIPISVSKKPEEGSRTIPIFPEGTINLSVKELEEAPSEQIKAKDFFTKYNYNPRCERNFDGLIKNLNGQY